MPTPDQRAVSRPIPAEVLRAMARDGAETDVAAALDSLRHEVALLREAIAPRPSPLITGQRAVDAFARLRKTP